MDASATASLDMTHTVECAGAYKDGLKRKLHDHGACGVSRVDPAKDRRVMYVSTVDPTRRVGGGVHTGSLTDVGTFAACTYLTTVTFLS